MFLTVVIVMLVAAVLLTSAYTVGPYLWGLSIRSVVKRGNSSSKKVALTFDDGPDPRYTPRCLEILNAHRVQGTFFLIGQKVKMYPDLVRQILAQGHDVGNHTYSHQHHWTIGPIRAMRDVRQGDAEIARAVGKGPQFFRPSYGVMNLFTYWQARRLGQRCVLWSIIANDWEGGAGGRSAETIAATVNTSLEGGAIILLHDSGGAERAPETMLEALPGIISEAKRRGLHPVAMREMLEGK